MSKQTKSTDNANEIWDQIKDYNVSVFALENKTVKDYLNKVDVPGDVLHVVCAVPAALPAIETLLNKEFNLDFADKYILIKRK